MLPLKCVEISEDNWNKQWGEADKADQQITRGHKHFSATNTYGNTQCRNIITAQSSIYMLCNTGTATLKNQDNLLENEQQL